MEPHNRVHSGKLHSCLIVLNKYVCLTVTNTSAYHSNVQIIPIKGHYNNAYKDFTYNIKKWNITYMFLFTVIRKVIYK